MGNRFGTKQSWITFGKGFVKVVRSKKLTGMSQQIAYNILFALGPLLIFITAFCGFVTQKVNAESANPVKPVTDWLNANLPSEAADFLKEPVAKALTTSPGFLISFGGLFALWGAKGAMGAIMEGLNEAYGVKESRSWLVKTGTAVGLTIALAVALILSGALFFLSSDVGQDIADNVGIGTAWSTASTWLRWPIIACLAVGIIVLLHRYAPDFTAPLRWYLPGAAFTLVMTLIATLGLRLYFATTGSYSEAYGVFGAVLAFVFFLYVVGIVILMGGVFNGVVRGGAPTTHPASS
jgi:membrane protein